MDGGDFPAAPQAVQEAMQTCPVCDMAVPAATIEDHVNVCLTRGAAAAPQNGSSYMSMPTAPQDGVTPGGPGGTQQNVQQWAELSALGLDALLRDPQALRRQDLEMLERALDGHVKEIRQAKEQQAAAQ